MKTPVPLRVPLRGLQATNHRNQPTKSGMFDFFWQLRGPGIPDLLMFFGGSGVRRSWESGFFFYDDASRKPENGKSLEILKIENTCLSRCWRKNRTVLSCVRSYFCGLLAIRKSCFAASHMSAVIMRSLSCGDSWLCLLCRLFQLCWSLVCGCNCRRR